MKLDKTPPPAATPNGLFRPDGSWCHTGTTGSYLFHRKVVDLVKMRRQGCSPEEIAAAIEAERLDRAFPNYESWYAAPGWSAVTCSTSAERAVKDAGMGGRQRG